MQQEPGGKDGHSRLGEQALLHQGKLNHYIPLLYFSFAGLHKKIQRRVCWLQEINHAKEGRGALWLSFVKLKMRGICALV